MTFGAMLIDNFRGIFVMLITICAVIALFGGVCWLSVVLIQTLGILLGLLITIVIFSALVAILKTLNSHYKFVQ